MRRLLTSVGCHVAALVAVWGSLVALEVSRSMQREEMKPEDMTAGDVLRRTARAYDRCKSYRDTGVVKTVSVEATGNRTTERPFRTAFVRPDRFRFEFTDEQSGPESRYIVWQDGKRVETWSYLKPGVEQSESLRLPLAGAAGISGRSSLTVPALLFPEGVFGSRPTDLTEAHRIEDGNLGVTRCFRIEGKYGSPQTLWIDKETFLLRRIDSPMTLPNFRIEDTTTYEPVINEEVSDTALEFDHPKG